MKGNSKLAFTAEAIAFMRAEENSDKVSKYFVSSKIKRSFKLISLIIPKSYIKRINLSSDMDKLAKAYKPEQIIELACGYSPRGLIMTQKNKSLIYIETDFPEVIDKKKKILKEISLTEKIILSKNHLLVNVDALDADPYQTLKKTLDKRKRTLIIAETLTSYLNPSEHEFLIKNIKNLLSNVREGAYLSNEARGMLPGVFGKMLLFYRDLVAKTRSYKHFSNKEGIKEFFLKKGFKEVKITNSNASNNFVYLSEYK